MARRSLRSNIGTALKQLNSVVERQEKDLAKLQAEVGDLEERNRSVQAALDSAYK